VRQRSAFIALVVAASLVAAGCGNTRPAIATSSGPGGVSLARPLPGAGPISLAAARAAISFPVPQPHVAAAGPANLTGIFADRKSQQVALVYGGGEVTVMMAPAGYADPRAQFDAFLRENHAKATLGSVDGDVALVISPDSDAHRSNPGWVEFDQDRVDINVVSATRATTVLLKVARSLALGRIP
jgi:hypothetical protein